MKYFVEILSILGGMALLLHGMKLLSEGLQISLGGRLKDFLSKPPATVSGGLGVGVVFTAIVQFSGVTAITLMGLINNGIFNLQQAIPVLLGAMVGSTATAQIMAFRVGFYSLPIIALGYVILSVSKRDANKSFGQILMGLGILFLGMHVISQEVGLLTPEPGFVAFFKALGEMPIYGVIAGFIFTLMVQSSSATVGLIISLCMSPQNLVSLPSAIAMMIGASIGTSFSVLRFSVGATLDARRMALAQLFMRITAGVVAVIFIGAFSSLMARSSPDLARQVANAQLFFSIAQALLFLGLTESITGIMGKILPGEDIRGDGEVRYLDDLILHSPAVALGIAQMETIRMGNITQSMIESSREALLDRNEKAIRLVAEKEKVVDRLDDEIEVFLSKINKSALSRAQRSQLAILNHAIGDIERIADHANNICELAQLRISRDIKFSTKAFDEVSRVFQRADESVMYCMNMLQDDNDILISRIMHLEKEVDHLVITYENNHMDRLEEGDCSPEAGPIYLDILRNLERITDHTHNIAYAKKFGF